jgi:hypothetical protein
LELDPHKRRRAILVFARLHFLPANFVPQGRRAFRPCPPKCSSRSRTLFRFVVIATCSEQQRLSQETVNQFPRWLHKKEMPIEFFEKLIGIFVPPTAAGNYCSVADDVFSF